MRLTVTNMMSVQGWYNLFNVLKSKGAFIYFIPFSSGKVSEVVVLAIWKMFQNDYKSLWFIVNNKLFSCEILKLVLTG